MKFKKNLIAGSYTIFPHTFRDKRGIFTRNFCKKKYKSKKIIFNIKQTNTSFNKHKGTLRGFHFQTNTKYDDKIISCITGSICNVTIDLRKNSKTYLKKQKIIISSKNKNSLLIPSGCANAFLTLEENTTINYFMNTFYLPKNSKGIRFDDSFFQVKWPLKPKVISKRDKNFPKFVESKLS